MEDEEDEVEAEEHSSSSAGEEKMEAEEAAKDTSDQDDSPNKKGSSKSPKLVVEPTKPGDASVDTLVVVPVAKPKPQRAKLWPPWPFNLLQRSSSSSALTSTSVGLGAFVVGFFGQKTRRSPVPMRMLPANVAASSQVPPVQEQ
jgi:hypothetical protein